jgi:hypothetical protein
MTTTATHGYSFLDAETMGGDELRSLTAADLSALLADAIEAIGAEKATWSERTGRDLLKSKNLIKRTILIAERLTFYVQSALQVTAYEIGAGPLESEGLIAR